jgi:histidinol-phosphate aminotransferase
MNVCESILGLNPYQGGKPIDELKRELGLKHVIKLASNENPLGASSNVKQAINCSLEEIHRYPDGNGYDLKVALSKHLGIEIDTISLGNGSNELLELIARVFVCKPTDEVVFSQYAFVVYPLVTQALGATAKIAPAQNFGHNLDAMLEMIGSETKLIFIANPNNPTGTLLTESEVYNFLSKVPTHIPVVLDQAYYEYLDTKDQAIDWLNVFDNLIITRTFSKAYGLAGLRVGYSVSRPNIADYINRVREPFNVNRSAQIGAIAALNDIDYLQESVRSNTEGLKQLEEGFKSLNLNYIKSSANFIAVEFDNALQTYEKLLKEGVIVRPIEMPNFLRISVGTVEENVYLIQALKKIL